VNKNLLYSIKNLFKLSKNFLFQGDDLFQKSTDTSYTNLALEVSDTTASNNNIKPVKFYEDSKWELDL